MKVQISTRISSDVPRDASQNLKQIHELDAHRNPLPETLLRKSNVVISVVSPW